MLDRVDRMTLGSLFNVKNLNETECEGEGTNLAILNLSATLSHAELLDGERSRLLSKRSTMK